MSTLLSQISRLGSFFIDLFDVLKPEQDDLIECGDPYTSLEETHRMRHCPKDYSELGRLYTTLHQTYGDIEDTALFKTLLSEMQYAQMPLCKSWGNQEHLPKVPKELDAPFESTIITGADRMSYTVWVLWFGDRVEIVKPYPNRGIYRSNHEVFESNETADVMPLGVNRAAKITIGVVESDNILKGYQWLLYENPSEA